MRFDTKIICNLFVYDKPIQTFVNCLNYNCQQVKTFFVNIINNYYNLLFYYFLIDQFF